MDFKPLHDAVVLKLDARKTVSDGGIFVGESVDKQRRGIIVAVGTGKRLTDGSSAGPLVEVGEVVLFDKAFANTEVDGQRYFFVKEDQIIAVFDGVEDEEVA